MKPEADGIRKASGIGVVRVLGQWRVLFGGGQFLDGKEGLDEGLGKLLEALQNFGDGVGVEFKIGIGKAVFWEEVGEAVKELGEESSADVAENGGVGEEFKVHAHLGDGGGNFSEA